MDVTIKILSKKNILTISPLMMEYTDGKLFDWIHQCAKNKGCNTSELNTYVQNYSSHKFYYNHGYQIYGCHFYKTL